MSNHTGKCAFQYFSGWGWLTLYTDCDGGTDCHAPTQPGQDGEVRVVPCD
jgi:hypothetical protein